MSWQANVEVLTLFVSDLRYSKAFYHNQFGLSVEYEDADSVVLDCGNLSINLVSTPTTTPTTEPLMTPEVSDRPHRASVPRMRVTLDVDDVDATCAELSSRGILLLSEPTDRVGGFRNATFIDPDGYVWEIAQQLPQARTAPLRMVDLPVVPAPKILPALTALVVT
jgi:catechol 2,3-dioxygenase-like lactoylglutathione lyase family enzyme